MDHHRRKDEGLTERLHRRAALSAYSTLRRIRWTLQRRAFSALPLAPLGAHTHLAHSERLPLARSDSAAHPLLEAGKRHNVALAIPAFHGRLLTPQRPLSFWRTLGPATLERGYRHGMELQAGCVVPAIGGGLCLLSNGLFRLAVHMGWEILERHGHTTQAVPSAPGELFGLDATLYYPYVDLRIAPRSGSARLDLSIQGDALVISAYTDAPLPYQVSLEEEELESPAPDLRSTRLHRHLTDPSGLRLTSEVIAVTTKRLLFDEAQLKQSCLSCGQMDCHARPSEQELAPTRALTA
ncbi:MAG: VanW family protein [Myxococcota bacterium]|nr:VanW family protein [Myxococcota bacterium]